MNIIIFKTLSKVLTEHHILIIIKYIKIFRRRSSHMANKPKHQTNWEKVGAIVGILSLIVAVFGITIRLDFSLNIFKSNQEASSQKKSVFETGEVMPVTLLSTLLGLNNMTEEELLRIKGVYIYGDTVFDTLYTRNPDNSLSVV